MPEPKQYKKELPHGKLKVEWARFYHALGTFNTNIVARLVNDPKRLREMTDNLVAWCPEHDQTCNTGYIYDHSNASCVKMAEQLD